MTVNRGDSAKVIRIAGPVVGAQGLDDVRLFTVVRVGQLGLVGEVIRLTGDVATIQVYEDTSGVRVGEPVVDSGVPLMAHLGPGLLGSVYDGLQRPLEGLAAVTGDFIRRGADLPSLQAEERWEFTPLARIGTMVRAGDTLGLVAESATSQQHIMVPPGQGGRLLEIGAGTFRVGDVIARLEAADNHGTPHREITLGQRWPVRNPRPYRSQLDPCEPLVTGTRIIDALFPIAKGGSAIIPGGFGTGQTVAEHSLVQEIQSTTRRRSALEHVLIPRLESELALIRSVLAERERADHFRLKLMRHILERRRTVGAEYRL